LCSREGKKTSVRVKTVSAKERVKKENRVKMAAPRES